MAADDAQARGDYEDRVLSLIDAELKRLDERENDHDLAWWECRRRAWKDGVNIAREVAAGKLREIRAAYCADQLTREAEVLGFYDAPEAER